MAIKLILETFKVIKSYNQHSWLFDSWAESGSIPLSLITAKFHK